MKLFERKKYDNAKREIYFCGLKVLSYVNWKRYKLCYGIIDYNNLPITENILYEKSLSPVISIIYPVYYSHNNFENFISLIKRYEGYSSETKAKIEIIIVDDCSKYPISLPESNLNISLLRIEKDIPWNNSGARNLGACFASSSRLVMMDADWFLPEETLLKCIEIKLSNNDMIPLKWVKNLGEKSVDTHPNIFCLNKQTFFKYNCYDEAWCGFYGEDLFFRRYLHSNGINFIIIDNPILPHGKNYITNDSHNLSRNVELARKKLARMKILKHNKVILNFPWAVIETKNHHIDKLETKISSEKIFS